jgi:hypothetical protein
MQDARTNTSQEEQHAIENAEERAVLAVKALVVLSKQHARKEITQKAIRAFMLAARAKSLFPVSSHC